MSVRPPRRKWVDAPESERGPEIVSAPAPVRVAEVHEVAADAVTAPVPVRVPVRVSGESI